MGQLFFGVDIQAVVADAIGPSDLPPITLRKRSSANPTTPPLSGPPVITTTDYLTRGVVEKMKRRSADGAQLVSTGDQKVILIAKPLADAGVVPDVDDEIVTTTDGTLRITEVLDRDPAVAHYAVMCRG